MKIKKRSKFQPAALAVLGVFLGRGAQADTVLDFDTPPGPKNAAVDQSFGDYALASSDGVTVTGFGTPNIGLTWSGTGHADTEWEYYNDSVWSAAQLNRSIVGDFHYLTFTPNNASARAVVKSFNFHPYYDGSGERFTYDVSVLSGATVVSGPIHVTFLSDATKNHPVNVNYTGTPGQTLKLRLARVPSVLGTGEVEGDSQDIAVDDIAFAQLPTSVLPVGPLVISVSPTDGELGVAAVNYSYSASITNGDSTTVVGSSVTLRFDGSLVSPTVTSANGLTNVNYVATSPRLASGSTHLYTLSYADNLGATYTNQVSFAIATYPSLPPSWASPPGSGSHAGFLYRTVAAYQDTADLDSSIARAKAQLAGTLIDASTGLPYTNSATLGTNADGSWNINDGFDFLDSGPSANFQLDLLFPGLDSNAGPYDWFSTEAILHLDLAAGYHRLGVNSDDGFELSAIPPTSVSGSPMVLALFDGGRSPGDTMGDFLVQTSGVYPFKLIYFESTGGAECELFSVNLSTGEKTLVNDPASGAAVKSFLVVPPRITSIAKSGANVVINWVDGFPPFQVQFKNNLTGAWSNFGSPTSAHTATVPIQPGAGFIRVVGSP